MINETLNMYGGEVTDGQQEERTSYRDQNAKAIFEDTEKSEKYTNLMRLNEEESIEWVNMLRNKPSGIQHREIMDFLEWLNMQQTRVLVKPTASILATENKTKETIVEPVKKGGVKRSDLPQVERENLSDPSDL
jgi:hypothetical protein